MDFPTEILIFGYMKQEGFQKCPICEGSVMELNNVCSVCAGYKIISVVSGQPPIRAILSQSPTEPMPLRPTYKTNGIEYRIFTSNGIED